MKEIQFPISLIFKISSFSNDFTAYDGNGNSIAYVKQKLFKLKEKIAIYRDESKREFMYSIEANKWLDFSAAYSISDASGRELGKIARKGWASLWKASYDIMDEEQQLEFKVQEANGWVKVVDSLVGEIPVIGFFTGYILNPTYHVLDNSGNVVASLIKEPSFWGRKFRIEKFVDLENEERLILALMMMILLERRRG